MGLKDILVLASKGDEGYVDDVCKILSAKRNKVRRGRVESRFHEDSEPYFRINEKVGDKDVFFISRYKRRTNDDWIEMLNFANAALNQGANSVSVFETYLGCSRQERKSRPGEAVTLQAKAQTIMGAGIQRYSTFAAHADSTTLAFDPKRTLFTNFPLWTVMTRVVYNLAEKGKTTKYVSPDAGAAKNTREVLNSTTVQTDERFANDQAIIDKDRVHVKGGGSKSGALIGNVEGMTCVLQDDESVSANSICDAAEICLENGAEKIYVALSHAKFAHVQRGWERMAEALDKKTIDTLITTNSCAIADDVYQKLGLEEGSERIIVIPTQAIVAEYIKCAAEQKEPHYLFSSRGVLRPYLELEKRVRWAETGKIPKKHGKRDHSRFKKELGLYDKLAKPVLGDYHSIIRSHS